MRPSTDIATLLSIMAALRTPGSGCPWDLQQTFATIVPYTIEEAYEVADAVARGDLEDLRDELGDLLLQVVFHARMAEEAGAFDFGGVVEAISAKMIRRHPHVFASGQANDAAGVKVMWEEIKAGEKASRLARRGFDREAPGVGSLLDDVPVALPGLQRAVKLQKKAARVGFDWPVVAQVLDKVREETGEAEAAISSGDEDRAADEIGDLLFAVVNLARHAGVDPEAALMATNRKFARRFRHVEARAAEHGGRIEDAGLDRMEGWWQEAKQAERSAGNRTEAASGE